MGWDGDGSRQSWTALGFLPSLYHSVDLGHLLNPLALAVTSVSPNRRKTMLKLDSLDYICTNQINIQFQTICCLLPQAKDFSFFLGFWISVLVSAFWGFSWFCLFVFHQRLIFALTYLRQVVAWGVLAPVCGGTNTLGQFCCWIELAMSAAHCPYPAWKPVVSSPS